MSPRRGAILVVVAGACALLASLSLAFLLRMRSDSEETDLVQREAQARLMLMAGCGYVLEASRLGYDYPSTTPPGATPPPASALPLPPAGFHRDRKSVV